MKKTRLKCWGVYLFYFLSPFYFYFKAVLLYYRVLSLASLFVILTQIQFFNIHKLNKLKKKLSFPVLLASLYLCIALTSRRNAGTLTKFCLRILNRKVFEHYNDEHITQLTNTCVVCVYACVCSLGSYILYCYILYNKSTHRAFSSIITDLHVIAYTHFYVKIIHTWQHINRI